MLKLSVCELQPDSLLCLSLFATPFLPSSLSRIDAASPSYPDYPTADPTSVTVFNPIHRSPNFPPDGQQNGFSSDYVDQHMGDPMRQHPPPTHAPPLSYPAYLQPQFNRRMSSEPPTGHRTSVSSDASSMSAPPVPDVHGSHHLPHGVQHPWRLEGGSEGRGNASARPGLMLSSRNQAPPPPLPKPRKVTTLAAVS